MKRVFLTVGVLLVALAPALGQLSVEVVLSQDQFLRGESLPVAVRITNRSGQSLRLGGDEDWLVFSIESREVGVVPKSGEAPVLGEFVLDSSKVGTKRVDLAPYFPLTTPGRYSVTATVKIKEWNAERSSPPKSFDVIEGARLWEQEFGVPPARGATNAEPEVRKYTLQQANYIRGHLRLYLRVTDLNGKVVQVTPIGPVLSFSRPEANVDPVSNLHVLYQDRPHAFSYTSYNPDGELLLRQTYEFTTSRPRLQLNPEGKVAVIGGTRRVSRNDLPPAPKEASTSEQPKPEQGGGADPSDK
jgi:hypothetical protein